MLVIFGSFPFHFYPIYASILLCLDAQAKTMIS